MIIHNQYLQALIIVSASTLLCIAINFGKLALL